MLRTSYLLVFCYCFVAQAHGQDLLPKQSSLRVDGIQSDFPSLAIDAKGTPWVAYIAWDAKQDTLCLAKHAGGALTKMLTLGAPGIIQQPAMAADGTGALMVVWSQVNAKDLMELKAQRVRDGKPEGDVLTLASSEIGGNGLAKAATDRAGRIWVVWQSMRDTLADVFCRVFDPVTNIWSSEVQVTSDPAGDWEPCVVFDKKDGAWVIFDSSRGNEFNIYASHVGLDGKVGEPKTLIHSDRYEARASAVGTPDGKGVWIASERGNQEWGLAQRAHGGQFGLNGRRNSVLAYWNLETGAVEEMPCIDPLLASLPGPPANVDKPAARGNNAKATAKAEQRQAAKAAEPKKPADETPAAKRQAFPIGAVNLPHVMLDAAGRPWITIRYYKNYCWRIALARFDQASKKWTEPIAINASAYAQDRQTSSALAADGSLWIAWPSDLRKSKLQRTSGIQLVKIATEVPQKLVAAPPAQPRPPFAPYINPLSPERARDDRHIWTHDGVTYKLYWGDFHRHTDVSNCITPNDGCVLEAFRYALDMGKLDMLGTSDHTDIAKIYHPYEWWLNQKMVDLFYSPGYFTSMYAYEREQRWPYGHRNVIFAQRGGPIVYIERKNYLASPWQKIYPVKTDGDKEIMPEELWDILARYGKPVTDISHTGATGMGTNWDLFKTVDHRVENVVEIFQGARVSYEGLNAPQPTIGIRQGQSYNPAAKIAGNPKPGEPISSFTDKNNGLYQHALSLGHKLGVWADSDHISTHTSYGGVYVKEFTRLGIIEAINARRTIAATDKIFLEFTCNGKMLGTEIEVHGKPILKVKVEGTAVISRVTVVRNEQNYQQWKPDEKDFEKSFTDESPLPGENRYYIRVEQADGSMAWSSPIWVEVK